MTKKRVFQTLLFALALAPLAANAADSLIVKPAHPTTGDSLRLTIVIPFWDCCTHYTWDSTSAPLSGNNEVLLSYQHYLPKFCPEIACIEMPMLLPFKRGPLPRGTYEVYESAQEQCTTLVCPGAIIAPVKIGEFTVQAVTAANPYRTPGTAMPFAYTGRSSVYNIRGELVTQASRGYKGIYMTKSENGRISIDNGLFKR